MSSAHARYRRALELLADDATLTALFGPGTRHYGRFHPDRTVWATLVLDLDAGGLTTVEVTHAPRPGSRPHPVLGHLRTIGPADDPELPGLGPVLAELDRPTILRYRPGKRCTLRGGTAQGEQVVKVVAAADGGALATRLHRQQAELARAHREGTLTVRVAEPGRLDAAAGWMGQQLVSGRPIVDDLLGADGPALGHRLGRALGQLATASLHPPLAEDAATQLARSGRAVARLVDRLPDLAPVAAQVRAELARRHRELAPRALVPVHGAPHMHQWLTDGDQLALIDFDRYARGEPELDVATLVAELETESELRTSPDAIEAEVVAGFETAGMCLDRERLGLYRVHKRLAKATRSAWALRPDADERAARHLGRVADALAPA